MSIISEFERLLSKCFYLVLKRPVENTEKPYSIRSYRIMIPLWCYMRLFRVERVREADKGKNKGKKSRRNEITPGGGMKEICGFVRGQLQRWSYSFLLWCGSTAIVDSGALPQQIHPIRDHCPRTCLYSVSGPLPPNDGVSAVG